MFKFGKNEDLLATIDKQKDQIQRYESRLRDIVQAYKSLQKEKDALEVSMKALTSAPSPRIDRAKRATDLSRRGSKDVVEKPSPDNDESVSNDEGCDNEIESKSTRSEKEELSESDEEEDSHVQHLRSQIYTLTTSLSTVTEEKAKIVATYQAEKKKMKQEQEVSTKLLKEENEALTQKIKLQEEELERIRDKIRVQQTDREQEQATHSIMLREIQRMLNDERTKNDKLETVVKELRSMAQHAGQEAQHNEDYKRRVRQLEEELLEVRKRLKSAEKEANTPSPLLLQLQNEMEQMRVNHNKQLQLERHRVEEMEEREKRIAKNEEERVADLENRLVQISNKLGMYDGSRQKDQLSIQKLKDRIAQLDVENTLLAKQLEAVKESEKEDLSVAALKSRLEDSLDLEGLKDQIVRYQHLLKEAAAKSNEPVDLSDVVKSLQSDGQDYQRLYLDSQQQMLEQKEEFERYKTRAQNVLKNMKGSNLTPGGVGTGGGGNNRELEELKRQLQEARERHFHLRVRCDDLEEKSAQLVAQHKQDMDKQAAVHRQELDSAREKHTHRLAEVERDIRSQRERTVAMLADKDKEIKHLKAYSATFSSEYQMGGPHEYERHYSLVEDGQDPTEESVSEIMSKGSVHESNIIHYVEQLARKDVAINAIRRHKKQLELQIRQLQDANIMKDERNAQELAKLRENMMEYERKTLRESANMEYLKNILYQYLTTSDATARQRIMVAIVTILQFSPEECRKAGVRR